MRGCRVLRERESRGVACCRRCAAPLSSISVDAVWLLMRAVCARALPLRRHSEMAQLSRSQLPARTGARCARWRRSASPHHPAMSRHTRPLCAAALTVSGAVAVPVRPALMHEFHPTLNGTLRPETLSRRSNVRVWWQCSKVKDHVWNGRVCDRNFPFPSQKYECWPWWQFGWSVARHMCMCVCRVSGCPFCSRRRIIPPDSIAVLRPALAVRAHTRVPSHVSFTRTHQLAQPRRGTLKH